jgi:hypothetical protein
MWTAVVPAVPADLLAAARAAPPFWGAGQPDYFTDVNGPIHQQIVAEVQAAGGTGFSSTSSSSPNTNMLPAMTSTAAFNFTPWLIGGGLAAGALLLTRRGRR